MPGEKTEAPRVHSFCHVTSKTSHLPRTPDERGEKTKFLELDGGFLKALGNSKCNLWCFIILWNLRQICVQRKMSAERRKGIIKYLFRFHFSWFYGLSTFLKYVLQCIAVLRSPRQNISWAFYVRFQMEDEEEKFKSQNHFYFIC